MGHSFSIHAGAPAAVAELSGLLASPVRWQIAHGLQDGESSLTELLRCTELSRVTLSPHLAALCRAGAIVRRRRQGQTYYSLQDRLALRLCRTTLKNRRPDGVLRSRTD